MLVLEIHYLASTVDMLVEVLYVCGGKILGMMLDCGQVVRDVIYLINQDVDVRYVRHRVRLVGQVGDLVHHMDMFEIRYLVPRMRMLEINYVRDFVSVAFEVGYVGQHVPMSDIGI